MAKAVLTKESALTVNEVIPSSRTVLQQINVLKVLQQTSKEVKFIYLDYNDTDKQGKDIVLYILLFRQSHCHTTYIYSYHV